MNIDTETKGTIERELAEGAVWVIFTKRNGEERRMLCTTNPNSIPEAMHPKGTMEAARLSEETKRVFDIEKQEWRSFRWDSLKEAHAGETDG